MQMKQFSATDAKNRFGELLEEAANGPVSIQKNGRDIAVLISKADFEAREERIAKRQLVQQFHEESISEFEELYSELAK